MKQYILWVCLIMLAVMTGCAKDPQVQVTPFVMKPTMAQATQNQQESSSLQPATRPYEEDITSGTDSNQ
jgi:hypothetical protein